MDSLTKDGYMDVPTCVSIGQVKVSINVVCQYLFTLMKDGTHDFDVYVKCLYIHIPPNRQRINPWDVHSLLDIFGEQYYLSVYRGAKSAFFDEVYPKWYAEMLE